MAKYVDGYVLTIKKSKEDEYQKMAEEAGKMWMKHGALHYFECIGDDLLPDMDGFESKISNFKELTNLGEDENVIFAFIIYNSKEHRDEVNAKVMADPEMQEPPQEIPFEMKKMVYGGFRTIVDK